MICFSATILFIARTRRLVEILHFVQVAGPGKHAPETRVSYPGYLLFTLTSTSYDSYPRTNSKLVLFRFISLILANFSLTRHPRQITLMSSILLRRAILAGATPQGRRVRLTSPAHRLSSTQSSQNPTPPRGTHRLLSTVSLVAASATIALTAYTLGVLYPPSVLTILFPRPAPAPPTDVTSPESIAYTKSIEDELQSLPILKALRARADASEWYEARPYIKFPEERRVNNLTAGALRGPGKLAVAPIIRAKKDESEGIAFLHLGRGLCGHDGIIHGGLLATLLDETLARTVSAFFSPVASSFMTLLTEGIIVKAINNLPERVGVTANLHINYRAPTRADQVCVPSQLVRSCS